MRSARRTSARRGYVSMIMVGTIAMITVFGLATLYKRSHRAQTSQTLAQIRIDYSQKEDAMLRGLIATVPNRAIAAMKSGSASSNLELKWDAVFNHAIAMANAEQSIDINMLTAAGNADAIVANPGDNSLGDASNVVGKILDGQGFLQGGNTQSLNLLMDADFGPILPPPLTGPSAQLTLDHDYPIITRDKVYSAAWPGDTELSIDAHPLYNRIPYPNIRFGYTDQAGSFVAKRNWWAFSVRFGNGNPTMGIPPMVKHYVLSIYEVPMQLPISAESFVYLGQHSDGTQWTNTNIDGSVSAGVIETDSTFDLASGLISGRKRLDINTGTRVQGESITGDFEDLGVREVIQKNQADDFYLASTSSNAGRVAYVPLNPGLEFYTYPAAFDQNTLSSTAWDQYVKGAAQCQMKLFVTEVRAPDDQTPTEIEFHYKVGGVNQIRTFTRGVNWPLAAEAGGSTTPFQTEHLENGRESLTVYLDRLVAYMNAEGADPVENSSLVINPDPSRSTNIKVPEFPTSGMDMALTLRKTQDFSSFTDGFAVVTNLRVYLADDFNLVSIPLPANSGLPAGTVFYPPVVIFAPEKRYGTTLETRMIDYKGQVSSLSVGDYLAVHPLDFRAGTYDQVDASLIDADLWAIQSPVEIPPITLMNWIITVEELQP